MDKSYTIRTYPDPVLRKNTVPIEDFGEELKKLMSDMERMMFKYDGVGLAAPQIGLSLKIAIVYYEEKLYTIINPEIVERSGAQSAEEGCLSFPEIYGEVKRPQKIKVRSMDAEGVEQVHEVEGFLARAFCHEIDHLEGVLLLDHFSPMKKSMVKRKMLKRKKTSDRDG